MSYQKRILTFGEKILDCPHYQEGGACRSKLADVSNGVYKHGPEIGFVGDRYGQSNSPRILFTRLNPTWNNNIGWFGTRESVTEYRRQYPDANAADVFRCYLKGWKIGNKVYRGMWDAGTVTGHPIKSNRPALEKRSSPRYGIQAIMDEMIRAGVFPKTDDSPLQYCAINNVVKCSGSLRNWNPSNCMYRNCNYYGGEIDILTPHIVVAFGNDSDTYLKSKLRDRFATSGNKFELKLSTSGRCLYFKFPHPLGLGKYTWLGNDLGDLGCSPGIHREFGPKESDIFKAGPGGMSTERLFNYTMHLVSEAKKLKDNLEEY